MHFVPWRARALAREQVKIYQAGCSFYWLARGYGSEQTVILSRVCERGERRRRKPNCSVSS